MPPQKFSSVLPENFDGVFKFSNPYDEDFYGEWDSKRYLYPAHTRTPIIIANATPLEIQQIRKKFARELGEREYLKSKAVADKEKIEKANNAPALNSMHQANIYVLDEMSDFVQRCLEDLPATTPTVTEVPKDRMEEKLKKDPETGKVHTDVLVNEKISLKDKALNAQ